MKSLNFAFRNYREIIRDPLSVIFCLLLPLFLLFIFQQFEIPNDAFLIENFTPGIVIFGFSFITLLEYVIVSSMHAKVATLHKKQNYFPQIVITNCNQPDHIP